MCCRRRGEPSRFLPFPFSMLEIFADCRGSAGEGRSSRCALRAACWKRAYWRTLAQGGTHKIPSTTDAFFRQSRRETTACVLHRGWTTFVRFFKANKNRLPGSDHAGTRQASVVRPDERDYGKPDALSPLRSESHSASFVAPAAHSISWMRPSCARP